MMYGLACVSNQCLLSAFRFESNWLNLNKYDCKTQITFDSRGSSGGRLRRVGGEVLNNTKKSSVFTAANDHQAELDANIARGIFSCFFFKLEL